MAHLKTLGAVDLSRLVSEAAEHGAAAAALLQEGAPARLRAQRLRRALARSPNPEVQPTRSPMPIIHKFLDFRAEGAWVHP